MWEVNGGGRESINKIREKGGGGGNEGRGEREALIPGCNRLLVWFDFRSI